MTTQPRPWSAVAVLAILAAAAMTALALLIGADDGYSYHPDPCPATSHG